MRSRVRFPWLVLLSLVVSALGISGQAAAAVTYVQSASLSGNAIRSSASASFTAAQTAGNFNVVFIAWQGPASNLLAVGDSAGNTYTRVLSTSYGGTATQVMFYARIVAGAAAGKNAVTATFNAKVTNPDLRLVEYSGVDSAQPLDASGGLGAVAALTSSGAVRTTNANDLLLASNFSQQSVTGAGSGYTLRMRDQYSQVVEDATVSATGSYTATAPQTKSGWFVMQLLALRAAATVAPPVVVPNLIGQTQVAATQALTTLGLAVGTTSQASSATIPTGSVTAASPAAGASVASGSAVSLVISSGPAAVTVPSVVGTTQSAASATITGLGLVVGTVSSQTSATVATGSVISQLPVAGASVARGSAVNLVISSGAPVVTTPNVVGATQAAAGSTITGLGLVVGTVTSQTSATVTAGSVISQVPAAGAGVAAGSAVNLVVSSGAAVVPPVTVPSVVGATQAAASTTITGLGLVVGTVTSQTSATVATGSVISQLPAAGASAASGSSVSLVVSSGAAVVPPVTVPSVVGATQAAASTTITGLGLVVGTVTSQTSATVTAGSVISQVPAAGAGVAAGSAVNLVVSSGAAVVPPVTVPSVVGATQTAASTTITGLGLVVGTVTSQTSATVATGSVISQLPAAGASAASGSSVSLVVSSGPAVVPPVTVPSVVGATQAAASTTITGLGLVVGTVTSQTSATVATGSVISQLPAAGASAASGSAVSLVVSSGAPAAGPIPYPASSILASISWDESSKQRYAAGSDIWDSMWASDGLVYGVWGDGNGFSAPAKKQIGVSRLAGSPASGPLTGTDVYLGSPSPRVAPCGQKSTLGGKPHGVVALPNAVMYMFHSTSDLCTSLAWLARSADNGVTWTDNVGGGAWPDANGFSPVAVLQYGAGQSGALIPDGTGVPYLYIYASKGNNAGAQYLARVPAVPSNAIESPANWSYYAGVDVSGNPLWATSSAQATAVWSDSNYAESLGVTFDAALGRYIAYNDHGNACAGSPCERQVSLFDSPTPWGPWTTFDYEEQFDNTGCGSNCLGSQEAVGWSMMQKWFSPDGLSLWVQYSSINAYDSLNLIKGTIGLAAGSTVTNLAVSTGAAAVVDRLSLSDPGNLEFIDRSARLNSIPASMVGAEVIRLPRNDAAVATQNYLSFNSTTAQNVCVAWNSVLAPPAWLAGWTNTGQSLAGDVAFNLYSLPVPAGTVTLPGPGSTDAYLVVIGCD